MAGLFELFVDGQLHVRFRLIAPDGAVMAVSKVLMTSRPLSQALPPCVSTAAWDTSPIYVQASARTRRVPRHTGSGQRVTLEPGTGHSTGPRPGTGGPAPPDQEPGQQLPSPLRGYGRLPEYWPEQPTAAGRPSPAAGQTLRRPRWRGFL